MRWTTWFRNAGSRVGRVSVLALCAGFLVGWGIKGAAVSGQVAPVRLIRSVPVGAKVIALTFDDGPSPQYTPKVLDLLRQYGAKATFFVIGQELVRYPQIARQEFADGMELANHGFRHLTLVGMDPTTIEADVKPVEQEITAITGQRPTLFRLPQGKSDSIALRSLTNLGYTIVYWSIDTRDYLPRSPQTIAKQVLQQVQSGSIVIFHDGGGNQQHTVDALQLILPALRAQGYKEVTVSQLMELASSGAQAPGA